MRRVKTLGAGASFALLLTAGCDGTDLNGSAEAPDLYSQPLSLGVFPVKPSADDLKSGVTGVGDTSALWKNVDDGITPASTDNDTSYVHTGTNATGTHRLRFAGARDGGVSQVTVRYRARTSSASGTAQIRLYDGGTLLVSAAQRTLSGSYADLSDTFTNLAVADVNNLRAEIVLRRTSGTGHVRYTQLWVEATLHPITHTVEALVYKDLSTCVVGTDCTSGDCIGLFTDGGVLQVDFERPREGESFFFHSVPPTDPFCNSAPKHHNVRLSMTAAEVSQRRQHLENFRANVFRWSGGEINLKLNIREIGPVDMGLGEWGGGLWINPWSFENQGKRTISRFTDFTIATHGSRDATQGLKHLLGGCGGTFGGDLGRSGAGHSWIPFTAPGWGFECSVQDVYTHEWLHQSHWALNNLSGFNDLYGWTLPACGAGDPDTTRWFPDTHQCNQDPDFPACGAADCGGNDVVNQHVLGAHWKAGRVLKANHCRNGLLDHDESATDVAADCPAVITRTPAAGAVTASANDGNVPGNAVDNNTATRWSADGVGQWLRFDLGAVRRVSHLTVAVYQGNTRRNLFDVQVSNDGSSWTTVWSGASSGGSTGQELIDFPDVDARYVRYLGRGNHANNGTFATWNSVSEVDVFGYTPTPEAP
jgi:hypothetical protein